MARRLWGGARSVMLQRARTARRRVCHDPAPFGAAGETGQWTGTLGAAHGRLMTRRPGRGGQGYVMIRRLWGGARSVMPRRTLCDGGSTMTRRRCVPGAGPVVVRRWRHGARTAMTRQPRRGDEGIGHDPAPLCAGRGTGRGPALAARRTDGHDPAASPRWRGDGHDPAP